MKHFVLVVGVLAGCTIKHEAPAQGGSAAAPAAVAAQPGPVPGLAPGTNAQGMAPGMGAAGAPGTGAQGSPGMVPGEPGNAAVANNPLYQGRGTGNVAAGTESSSGGVTCHQFVVHLGEAIMAFGSETTAGDFGSLTDQIAKCEQQGWSPSVLACGMTKSDLKSIIYDCYSQLIPNPPAIARTFDMTKDNSDANPPVAEANGDYLQIDKNSGVLIAVAPPATAMYYVANGKMQGPIMLGDEARELFAALGAEESQRHAMATSMIGKLKTNNRVVREFDVRTGQVTHTPSF